MYHDVEGTMMDMNRLSAACVMATMVISSTACASMNNTEKGATAGATTGAVIGGVIGGNNGSTAKGAILGAAIGGAAGAVIGRQMDKQAAELQDELDGATVERVGEGIQVTFDSGILFGFDRSDLQATARQDLRDFAESLREYSDTRVLIVGHTDAVGSSAYNEGLSIRRAQSAANFLTSQGVAQSRVDYSGRGELEPVADNESEAGRAANRRVEMAIFASPAMRAAVKQSGS